MTEFQKGYARVLDNIGGVAGTFESSEYASKVEASVDEAIAALQREAAHRVNVSEDYLKGWLAEQWHAGTLKASAAARGRSDVWANVPANNSPGDDVRYGDSSFSKVAEVKYYKTAEDTAKAVSRPEYDGRTKVVPADQREDVAEAAARLAEKNRASRPEQAAHYQDTADHAGERIQVGNASSKPLDEKHAKEIAREFKHDGDIEPDRHGLNTESIVEWSDIARQSGEAAFHAAALSAALSAAPHVWGTLQEYLETGVIDPAKLAERGRVVLMNAGTAGLRGGVAAGLTAACKMGLMGEALKGISPSAIGMATTITLNAIDYSIKLQQGRITGREFAHCCLRDSFVLTGAMCGAAVGQVIIPIPLLGALAGNIVGSMLSAVAFQSVNQVVLGVCVDSGWTFFGMVEQDYVVPEDVLRQAGYDLFSSRSFTHESFSTASFTVKSFSVSSLSFTTVRRGVISCCAVGYL